MSPYDIVIESTEYIAVKICSGQFLARRELVSLAHYHVIHGRHPPRYPSDTRFDEHHLQVGKLLEYSAHYPHPECLAGHQRSHRHHDSPVGCRVSPRQAVEVGVQPDMTTDGTARLLDQRKKRIVALVEILR